MKYALNDDDYTSTGTDAYENVTEENWRPFMDKAMTQYREMKADERISGFYLVDWRVNFSNLHDYIMAHIHSPDAPDDVKEFAQAYEDSVDTLYRRLGITL